MFKFLAILSLATVTACTTTDKPDTVQGGGGVTDTTSGGDKAVIKADSTVKMH